MSIVEVIKCDRCGASHDIDCESFYTVYGNILVGTNGGLVGNNIAEDGVVLDPVHYCIDCLFNILNLED